MADINVKQTGVNPQNGAEIYTVKIGDEIVGSDLSKLDVVMKLILRLGLPVEMMKHLHNVIDEELRR